MTTTDTGALEREARELLAAEYAINGMTYLHDALSEGRAIGATSCAIRAIIAALRKPDAAGGVTDAMVERACRARIPGGSEAWHWVFNGGQEISDEHRDWFRRVLTAARTNSASGGEAGHG